MKCLLLDENNLDKLVTFEQTARATEGDIFIDSFDPGDFKTQTLRALKDENFTSARCLVCVDENGDVVGRLDFTLLPSFAYGGELRAYVDWVYVLVAFRHKGVAQLLFKKMEALLKPLGVEDYFLLMAENGEAQRFYRNVAGGEIAKQEVLTKQINIE